LHIAIFFEVPFSPNGLLDRLRQLNYLSLNCGRSGGFSMQRLASGFRHYPRRLLLSFFLAFCAFLSCAGLAGGQSPGRAGDLPTGTGSMFAPVLVEVSVREANGTPLSNGAVVRLYSRVGSYNRTTTTRDGAIASFADVIPGEYEIEAQSAGYRSSTEHASVMGGGLRATFYLYLQPESSPAAANQPPGAPVVTPKLQKQIEKALEKLRKKQYEDALKELQRAEKMAPGNPDVHYLMGMSNSGLGRQDVARSEFEKALQIYPSHVRSLLALGELQLRIGQDDAAVKTLERAYQIDGADWRTDLLLAEAYFNAKEFEKAEQHAGRAAELQKGKSAEAQLLLARALLARGKENEAKAALETLTRQLPNAPEAAWAKKRLADLNQPSTTHASADGVMPSLPTLPVPAPLVPGLAVPSAERAWAPPDIDNKDYGFASGVACPQEQVLAGAQLRMKKQLENFEKFTATEHIVHVEIDANGIPGPPREKDFSYLVTLSRAKDGVTYLEESRDGGENLQQFPTSLAIKGLVSLGVAVLDRDFEGDFNFRCDGLTQWRNEAAWEIRFEQKKDVRSRLLIWRNSRGSFPVALRGRVWVSANSYNLLHLESDLREPQPLLELTRDHLVIDYGRVRFEHANTELWLPWHADAYMEFRRKRYHHTHTLTNYMLFSVDTTNKVAAPKQDLDQP